MGVYLSAPVTEKVSTDEKLKNFSYGASSMQGWRIAQEDAHNCIPEFDTDTALFAVYDGHGGAEVAKYCAQHLPDSIKQSAAYKAGNLVKSLEESFLSFDSTLTDDDVIKELKVLAGVDDEGDEEEVDGAVPVGQSETDMLRAEADMPLDELLSKYEGLVGLHAMSKKAKKEKMCSPMIKPKRPIFPSEDGEPDSPDSSQANACSSSVGSCSMVCELDAKLANGLADNENNLNAEKEMNESCQNKSKNSIEMGSEPSQSDCKSSNSSLACTEHKSDSNSEPTVSSSVSEMGEAVCSKAIVNSDAEDSSSKETCSSTSVQSSSVSKSDSISEEPGPSSSGSCSVTTSGQSSSMEPQPSGSQSCAADEPGPSGSSDEPCEAGSSGVPVSTVLKQLMTGEGQDVWGSDDSSEESEEDSEEEYNSEEEEEEGDDEEEEGEEEQGERPRILVGDEEEPHNEEPGTDSGCTAVLALLRGKELMVANAGDSRCIMCRRGKAIDLSIDHKPEDDLERKRIERAGGQVTADGRVNGGLNLSRAVGDHYYKRNKDLDAKDQMITALPDIETMSLEEGDEFMVIACDGIWNYMSSQDVVDFVKERLQIEEKRNKLSIICEEMFDHCLAPNTMGDGTGCDNMTCIIILFHQEFCNNNQNKRTASDLDTSRESEAQPEKRPRIEAAESE
ncbi:hypothetical protein ScPMuIL_005485 [Solemya velum]